MADTLDWATLGLAGLEDIGDFYQKQQQFEFQKKQQAMKWGSMGKFWEQLNPSFQNLMRGGDSPQVGMLDRYYQQSLENLGQTQNRSLGSAATNAGAYASSRGLNPYNFIERSQSDVYNSFAPQYGDLLSKMMLGKADMNQNFLNTLLGIRSNFSQQGG